VTSCPNEPAVSFAGCLLHRIFTVPKAFEKRQTKIQHPKQKSKIQPKPTVQPLEKSKQARPKKQLKQFLTPGKKHSSS
jgi:hypothetical protein